MNYAGGRVVHSYGRLIPHEFPITDLQQISGPDRIGRINCTVSSGTANFVANTDFTIDTGGVSLTRNGATLVVNPSNVDSFKNRDLYCTNINTNFFYLFISSTSKFAVHCHFTVLINITLPLKRRPHAVGPRMSASTRASTCKSKCYRIRTYGVNPSVYLHL